FCSVMNEITTTQRSGERQLSSCYGNMAIAEKDNIPKSMKLNVLQLGRDFESLLLPCGHTHPQAPCPLFS
ncbi:MAG TPA: hypothetical protein VIJ87_15920, partial [Pyrinomonadaceae bacterium]